MYNGPGPGEGARTTANRKGGAMFGRMVYAVLLVLCLGTTALAAGEAPLSAEAQELFDEAFEALDAGKPAQALPLYERALELAPDSYRIWVEYTSCLKELNRQPAAVRAGWRTVQLAPARESGGWVNLGNSLSRSWRFEEAALAYEEALKADGDKAKASRRFTSLGFDAENAGRRDAALTFYERALTLDPKNAIAWADKGRVLHCMGGERASASGACFEKAQKLAQKQKDTEALGYAVGTLLMLEDKATCSPWVAARSHQPLPQALLTAPAGDARQIPLPAAVEHRWSLPGGKCVAITLPETWEETLLGGEEESLDLFTARLEAPQSLRWSLLISLMVPKARERFKEPRRLAESVAANNRDESVEAELALVELKGERVSGWYYTATDKGMVGKPAQPDQWPFMTQGILDAGGQWVSFTLLSHGKQSADLEPVLEALATLKVE